MTGPQAGTALGSEPGLVESLHRRQRSTRRRVSPFCNELRVENEMALAYASYDRLHRRQGRFPEARHYLACALGIFERFGTRIESDKVRAELAELPAV